MKGVWSPTSSSCFKDFPPVKLSHNDSWTFCMNVAPYGTRGRLAHFPDAGIYSYFKKYNAGVRLGVVRHGGGLGTPYNASEWALEDRLKNGTVFMKEMYQWYSGWTIVNLVGSDCMGIWSNKPDDTPCSTLLSPICEFLTGNELKQL